MSARLSALNPKWITMHSDGRRVGMSFACPACAIVAQAACSGRVAVYFDDGPVSPPVWHRTGDTFDALTLTPSIRTHVGTDATIEHWHGFVTNGEVTP